MPFAFLLALAAAAGGTVASYLYDREAPPAARLSAGVCTGFAVLGLVGFAVASFIGLTPTALVVSALIVAAPLALLRQRELRARARDDLRRLTRDVRHALLHPRSDEAATLIFYAAAAVLFWLLFGRVMFEREGQIYTGVDNALGDLPFHLSIITSFAFGDNFPPQHPEFAGARLTYPFVVDFLAAMFVRAGATLQGALFWQNFALALSFTCLLQRWALKLTKSRAASFVTTLLVLFGGGLGWWRLVSEWRSGTLGLFDLLGRLPHDYSIAPALYRWGNALTTLLIPQRTLLLGLPLAIIVWTLWWDATEDAEAVGGKEKAESELVIKSKTAAERAGKKSKTKRSSAGAKQHKEVNTHASSRTHNPQPLSPTTLMLAAGVFAGLLPLVHAHTFVVVMAAGGALALLFRRRWRAWAFFFATALALAAPQMLWATMGSAVNAGTFFDWAFGWDHATHNVVWFWFLNTGLFIPLLAAALLARRGDKPLVPRKLLLFYLPFAFCFVLPNLFKFSPYLWDNIKLLFYWWIASAPLVALLLARLWERRALAWRAASAGLLLSLTLAGALDVWRVVSKASEQREFDRDGVALAELVKRVTPPRSLILHAPTYNHPVFLTGRRSVMGYAGHLWTHGLKYDVREAEVKRIYAGTFDAAALVERRGVDYVVVGPLERAELERMRIMVNDSFFERYTKVGEAGAYRLYQTSRR